MGIAARVGCDADGCERHIDVDLQVEFGSTPVTQGPLTIWLDGGIRVNREGSAGWAAKFAGKPARWRFFCRDHADLAR